MSTTTLTAEQLRRLRRAPWSRPEPPQAEPKPTATGKLKFPAPWAKPTDFSTRQTIQR